MEDHINITTDAQSKKIRLHFTKEVPTSLKTYLKRLGFMNNEDVPNVFHARLATTYIQFATDLQQCLLGDCEYTAIPIIPSYPAEAASIATANFSIATITFMEQGISKTEKKLVFDPRRSVATMIAEQYGKRMYGANFKSATAIPKKDRSGARKMLAQGDVILPEQQKIIAETPQPKAEQSTQQLTNSYGMYTEETAKDRYERIDIPIPKTAKYEAAIKIVLDENDQYRFAVNTQENFGDYSGHSSPLNDRSTPYATKNEALQLAIEEVITRIQSKIAKKDHVLSNQDPKNRLFTKALQATIAYAKKLGIEISDPRTQQQSAKEAQSKEETDTSIEMPISEVVSDTPSNESELTTIVQTAGEQLNALAIQSDVEKDKALIQNVSNTLNEISTTQETDAFEKTVQEFLKRQEISLSKLNRLITQQQFIDLFTPLTDALSLSPLEIPTYPKYRIVQKWTQVKSELLKRFQHLIDAKPDTLHFTYASSKDETTPPEALNVLKVTIESDRDMIGFLFEKETQSLIINTLSPNEESGVVYSGSAITTGKLSAAMSYMVAYPETILIKPYTIAPYPSTQKEPDTPTSQHTENSTTQSSTDIDSEHDIDFRVMEICPYDITIPNVRIPNVIPPPFDAGRILVKDTEKYLKEFPELTKINNTTIADANALQMYQLAHFNISKINISKEVFRNEWNKRGEAIFRALGFPMDAKYPYVNIIDGYSYVDQLSTIINTDYGYSSWLWLAVEYRPIADPTIAITEIDSQIEKYELQRNQYESKLSNDKHSKSLQKLYEKVYEKEITWTIKNLKDLQHSKKVIQEYIDVSTLPESIAKQEDIPEAALDQQQDTDVRTQLVKKGFTIPFTGSEAYQQNRKVFDLYARWGDLQAQYETHIENDHQKRIEAFEKRLVALKGKRDKESTALKTSLSEQITTLRSEIDALQEFLYEEQELFQKELYEALLKEVHQKAYTFTDEQFEVFRDTILEQLLEGRMIEGYADQPVKKVAALLIEDFFYTSNPTIKKSNDPDYLDKVIAIMHDHYIEGRRLTKKQVEAVKSEAGVPNLGMLWEAAELSWLLWYKMLYQQPGSFEYKLQSMTAFWDEVQPGYAYSDSSKELYKQYSTPCPIGAIIAEYTDMANAQKVFEPSAGNGLLVLGADPKKTHVNEIDNNRRASLEKQGFAKITYQNAAEPFPKQMTRAFDVMVTNPPFASWDAQVNEKKWIVSEFFNSYRRLDKNRLRLEHAMSGIALDTLKDSGKAALLLMGHIYFDDRGYIAKARPFFNWLYMHYHVDDVINLNGFTLYNKQGATPKTMLVLISGRKRKPTNRAIAPTRKQAGRLDMVVNTFEELWQRVQPHIKTPIDVLLQKLKIETNYDIL